MVGRRCQLEVLVNLNPLRWPGNQPLSRHYCRAPGPHYWATPHRRSTGCSSLVTVAHRSERQSEASAGASPSSPPGSFVAVLTAQSVAASQSLRPNRHPQSHGHCLYLQACRHQKSYNVTHSPATKAKHATQAKHETQTSPRDPALGFFISTRSTNFLQTHVHAPYATDVKKNSGAVTCMNTKSAPAATSEWSSAFRTCTAYDILQTFKLSDCKFGDNVSYYYLPRFSTISYKMLLSTVQYW